MIQSIRIHAALFSGVFLLSLLSCSKDAPTPANLKHTFPATTEVKITFDERTLPENCLVFSHLLVSIPAGMIETDIRQRVERFAQTNGADHLLVGMARESDTGADDILFRSYGPASPYSFSSRWAGWKFGFRDWRNKGPLVDYGYNSLNQAEPAFDTEITSQAILLRCQAE